MYEVFSILHTSTITSFEGFLQQRHMVSQSAAMLEELMVTLSTSSDPIHSTNLASLKLSAKQIKAIFETLLMQNVSGFLEKLLADKAMLYKIIFAEVELTENNVKKQFKKWAVHFHPDKTSESKFKDCFESFFKALCDAKKQALWELGYRQKQVGDIAYHQELAKYYRNKCLDAQDASNQNLSRLRNSKKEEFINRTPEECLILKREFARKSFEHCRAISQYEDCSKIEGDKGTLLYERKSEEKKHRQIAIRKDMAIALKMAGLKFEAHIYLIGACYIASNCIHLPQAMRAELTDLLASLNEEKRSRPESPGSVNSQQADNQINGVKENQLVVQNSNLTLALLSPDSDLAPANSPLGRHQRKQIAIDDFSQLAIQILAMPESQLVRYNSPHESIIHAQRHAVLHKAGAVAAGVAGAATAITGITVFALEIGQAITIGAAAGSVLGPVGLALGLVGGLLAGVAGAYFSWKLLDQAVKLGEEPDIRQRLNEMIAEAVQHYQKGDNESFLMTLVKPYTFNSPSEQEANSRPFSQLIQTTFKFELGNLASIKIEPDNIKTFKIEAERIISTLLKHGFRPDGIAYFLVIMGEVLLNCPLQIEHTPISSLREQASDIFRSVYSSQLLHDAAEKIDGHVRLGKDTSESWFRGLYKFFSYTFEGVPDEYFSDAAEAPFTARLQEMQHTARINFALVQIILPGQDNIVLAKKTICEINELIYRQYQYFSIAQHRIEAIEDLLCAIGHSVEPHVEEQHPAQLARLDYFHPANSKEKALSFFHLDQDPSQVDVLSLLNCLTEGLINLSSADFIKKITQLYPGQEMGLYQKIISDTGNLTLQALTKEYLPLISYVFQIEFKLAYQNRNGYEFCSERQQLRKPENPICCIHVIFKDHTLSQFPLMLALPSNNNVPSMLYHRLKQENKNPILRSTLYNQLGDFYREKGRDIHRVNHVRSLLSWDYAKESYEHSLALHPTPHACFGILECYQYSANYGAMLYFLKSRAEILQSYSQYYYFYAIAFRHRHDYQGASIQLYQALSMEPANALYKKEK